MAKCLNPVILNVGIKKDKSLIFTYDQLKNNYDLRKIDFSNKKPATILAPCGKCYNCRVNRARDWTIRTINEYSSKEYVGSLMYFFTLTYDNAHIGNNSLDYKHVQLFLKRLRQYYSSFKLKFLCVGEYGHTSGRMHWHLIIFGFFRKIDYSVIHKLWNYGNVDIDIVRSYSAVSYLLKYSLKDYKVSKNFYLSEGRTPPLFRCSKGFGRDFAYRNINKIYENGSIEYNSTKYRIPRYYREIYYKINFVDGWQEYDRSLLAVSNKMLDELRLYGFDVDLCYNFEFGSLSFISYYLARMKPIFNKINDEKYNKHFKHFNELI